ncbi:spore germination protein KC [Bacillus sp. OV166]|uniref:Ger(x)C family spore germination protein n=1 Tax=Bacillus sp. OV166 TaxID=1882763 RepID=UPI000A2AA8BA|nr:Ger(x)C family spore germination protein [Bacillus sp. OV166]SMQ79744.1 spore germination protein KC [Bacillus sp. OV166]
MRGKLSLIFLLCLATVLLSGCWDSAELQNLSVVSAIGIDKGGNKVKNRYRVTVQIVNPSQVAGGSTGGKTQASPVLTFTNTGSTLSEALRKMSGTAPEELFFPHLQLMVISEEMAKEGIGDLFDMIERDSQFRLLFPVLIVRGHSAEDVLKVTTPLEAIPSERIVDTLKSSKKVWGEYALYAGQVIDRLEEGSFGITGVQLNGAVEKGNTSNNMQKISPDAMIQIRGLALFKDRKFKKWLDGDDAHGVTWIMDEMKRTVMNIDCEKRKDAISIEIARSKSDIKVKIKSQRPVINITVHSEGSVIESNCSIDLSKNKIIEKLEKQTEKKIKAEVMAAVKAAQRHKSDIFGFSEFINIADKGLWKNIDNKWNNEVFPETEVNVKVKAFIRRTGMRTKSYLK